MNAKNYIFSISLYFSLDIATKNKKHKDYFAINCLPNCKLCNRPLKMITMVASFEKEEPTNTLNESSPVCFNDEYFSISKSLICDNSTKVADKDIDLKTNNTIKRGYNLEIINYSAIPSTIKDCIDPINNFNKLPQLPDDLRIFINNQTLDSKLSSCEMKMFRKIYIENNLFPKGYEKLFRALFHEICFFKIRNRVFKDENSLINFCLGILKFEDLSKLLLAPPNQSENIKNAFDRLIEGNTIQFLSKFRNLGAKHPEKTASLKTIFSPKIFGLFFPCNFKLYNFKLGENANMIIDTVLSAHRTIVDSGISLNFENKLKEFVSRETENIFLNKKSKSPVEIFINSLFNNASGPLKASLENLFTANNYLKMIPIVVFIFESFFEQAKLLFKLQKKDQINEFTNAQENEWTNQPKNGQENPIQSSTDIVKLPSFFSLLIENSELGSDIKRVLKTLYDEEIDKSCFNYLEGFICKFYIYKLGISEKIILLNYIKEAKRSFILNEKYFLKKWGPDLPGKYSNREISNFLITEVGAIPFFSRVAFFSRYPDFFEGINKDLIEEEFKNEELLIRELRSFKDGCFPLFEQQANTFGIYFAKKHNFDKFMQIIQENKPIKSSHSSERINNGSEACHAYDSNLPRNKETPQDNLNNFIEQLEIFICSNSTFHFYVLHANSQYWLFKGLFIYFENKNCFPKNYLELYSLSFAYIYNYDIRTNIFLDFWMRAIFTQEKFILDFKMKYFSHNVLFLFIYNYFHENSFKLKKYLSCHKKEILEELLNKIDAYSNIKPLEKDIDRYTNDILYSLKCFKEIVASVIENPKAQELKNFSKIPKPSKKRQSLPISIKHPSEFSKKRKHRVP